MSLAVGQAHETLWEVPEFLAVGLGRNTHVGISRGLLGQFSVVSFQFLD